MIEQENKEREKDKPFSTENESSKYKVLGFPYNPYLFIYVDYPCICKYFLIKMCLNQV